MVILTLAAAGSILFVAAQTGFLDGPRILANMAVDSWAPRRFAQLSDRLVTNNGVLLMGLAAVATLVYTRGSVSSLLVMYAINVFVTFSLTLIGMTRHWWQERGRDAAWKKGLALQGLGAVLCVGILIITVYEKAYEGGWMTIVVTTLLVTLAFAIKRHYLRVRDQLRRLDDQLLDIPVRPHPVEEGEIAREEPRRRHARQRLLGSRGAHGAFRPDALPAPVQELPLRVGRRHRLGHLQGPLRDRGSRAPHGRGPRKSTSTSPASSGSRRTTATRSARRRSRPSSKLCEDVRKEFPRSIFYLGQLVFENDKFYYRLLHNETAFAIQRRLQFAGLQAVVLPIRVLEPKKRLKKVS